MVKHACNFSSRGQRQKDHSEFETNMVYRLSCRSVRAIVQAGRSWSWRHLWEELAVPEARGKGRRGEGGRTVNLGNAYLCGVCLMISSS